MTNQRLRDYEIVMVLSPEVTEDEASATVGTVSAFIGERGGTINHQENWGVRRLAFPIQSFGEGNYFLARFTLDAESIVELDRSLNASQSVLRHLVVRMDKTALAAVEKQLVEDARRAAEAQARVERDAREAEARAEREAEEMAGAQAQEERAEPQEAAAEQDQEQPEAQVAEASEPDTDEPEAEAEPETKATEEIEAQVAEASEPDTEEVEAKATEEAEAAEAKAKEKAEAAEAKAKEKAEAAEAKAKEKAEAAEAKAKEKAEAKAETDADGDAVAEEAETVAPTEESSE